VSTSLLYARISDTEVIAIKERRKFKRDVDDPL